jgi:hypothetical protein
MLTWSIYFSPDNLSWASTSERLLLPVLRLLAYLAAGLLVAQALESLGIMALLSRRMVPLTRWAHMKPECGTALVAGFISGILANTILMNGFLDGRLSRKEVILSYLLNNGLPVYLLHLPTTLFVVVSLAGKAGGIYLAITFLAAAIRTLSIILYFRTTLPVLSSPLEPIPQFYNRNPEGQLASIFKKFRVRFSRIVMYTIPIYVIVFLMSEWGIFSWLRQSSSGWVSSQFFPAEAAGVVMFSLMAEFSSGFAAAGALLSSGVLTVKQTVIALILGTILASPIRAVRHQLPTHVGLFSLAFGSQLLLWSHCFRIISLLILLLPYIFFA